MKKESTKKSKLGLILAICLVAALAVGGVLLAVLGFGDRQQGAATGPVKLYWNVDRELYWGKSSTGFSSREPDADGVFRIKFAVDGQQVEMPVTDKTLVNAIDSMEVMVLILDGDGNIIDVQEAKNVIKHSVIKSYVQDVTGDTINANSVILMNGMRHRIKVTDKTKIYDMSGDAEFIGQEVKADTLSFLDCIHMFVNEATEEQTVFVLSHMEERKLFYRAEQMWNFSAEETLRQPTADGVYTLGVFHEGEYVELKTKDKDIADLFDYKSPYSPHFCFNFDEDGYIISIENSEVGKFGLLNAQRVEVLQMDGDKISATETIQGSQGRIYNYTIPADCKIYDASNVAKVEGRHGKPVDSLKLHDIINVWTDVNGTPQFIYIAQRKADSPAYWTFKQQYDNTKKETTRKPVKGWYEFELAEAGKGGTKIYKTKDKAIANQIDATIERVVGLKLKGNIIECVYAPQDLFGYAIIGRGSAVRDINSIFVNLIGFANPNNPTQIMMGESCKVYDVSGVNKIGTETELKVGDHVYSFRDLSGQVVAIFVTQRSLGGDTLYYNLDYQYDSTTGETKRQPNEKGYYEFLMAHKGKQVTVKTKSKDIANKIDAVGNLMMSLIVKNGVVTNVFNGDWAYNQTLSSSYTIKKVASDGTITLVYGENEFTVKPTKNTAIYNVSYDYDKYRGEKTKKFEKGDMLGVIADMYGEPMVIYVRHRKADHMYYRMTAILDEDGDGWYTGQFLCDGEILTLRTQDKSIVKQINDYAAPMGLALKGDVIRGYIVPYEVKGVASIGYNNWDVTKVNDRKVTVTYRFPGHEYTGVSETMKLAKNCKIYDVSPTAEKFGAEVTLQPGDRVIGYMDENKNHVYIYVTYRANRAAGMEGYCDHCGKNVYWVHWAGGSFKQVSGHYYLNTDVTVQGQAVIGGKDVKPYEIVLDLNGKTITSEKARAFLTYYGSTLTIMDSVGGGAMEATGFTGGHGGVGLVADGATLNLIGGTLRMIPSDQVVTSAGGLMIENSTLNMYGGVIEGGNAQKGELSDGLGGNIYGHNGVINLYDGIIRGGKATSNGGNIYSYNTVFTMYGGSLEGGEAGINGGNLYCANVTKNYFYGGSITGGKTAGNDGNIFILNDQAEVVLGDVTMDGGAYIGQAVVTVDGKPVIKKDIASGLTLVYGAKLDIRNMEAGTQLYVNATGVISNPTEAVADIIAANYIVPVQSGLTVDQEEGALVIKEQVVLGDCEHCGQQVQWKVWTGSAVSSGHYILSDSMTSSSQVTVSAGSNVILDLNGKTLTANTRAFVVAGELTILDSVGGGIIEATGFTGGHGSVGMIDGKLNLYGGTLTMKESDAVVSYGGVIILGAPTAELNMYGGVIENGYAQTGESYKGYGGNIYSYGATINLYGGTIRGGKADIYGGNIYCANASKVNLYGGTIEGGITNGNDGNIFILNDQATFLLGDVTLDGGVYVGQAVITVNGKPVIKKNNGAGLTLDYGAKLDILDMQAGTELYLNASGVISTPTAQADAIIAAGYIKTVREDLAVTKDTSGALKIGAAAPNCDHCSQFVSWKAWDGTGNLTTGHYYLTADVTRSAQITVAADNDVVLDLKGFDITSTARAFSITGDLTLMDTVGEGIVAATGFTGGHGGVAMVDGSLTLMGGTLKMTASDAVICKGGVLIMGTNSILDMRGGVIEGGKVQTGDLGDGMGGNIYAVNATIMISGGTIRGGSASVVGGNIAMEGANCTLSVSGDAVIEGGSAQAGGNVSMYSGTAMTMTGGTIQNGNAAYINASFGGGGNIFAYGATVNISGGTVKNGTTNLQGGNIALRTGATMNLSGTASVQGGTATYDGGSIQYFQNTTVTISDTVTVTGGQAGRWGGNIFAEGNLTITGGTVSGGKTPSSYGGNVYACAGNFTMTGGTLTAGEARWGGNLYIHSDIDGTTYKAVIADDGNTETAEPVISAGKVNGHGGNIMAAGKLEIQAGTITGGLVENTGDGSFGGNIYLEGDTAGLTVTGGTIAAGTAPAGGNIASYLAPVTMTAGTVKDGVNNYASGSYGGGGNIFLMTAPMTISGGTIANGNGYQGGNIYARNEASVITVSGNAVIEGGQCTWDGANILLFNWAKLDLQSGTITDGTAGRSAAGVLVDKYAKCNLAGGTVGTVTVANNAAEMNVSGAVFVGNLDLTSGAFVNVGTMANGAEIKITANDGQFSTKNSNAVTYAEMFKSAVTGKKVQVVDGALHMVNA